MQQPQEFRGNRRPYRQQGRGQPQQNLLMERDALSQQVTELDNLLQRELAGHVRERKQLSHKTTVGQIEVPEGNVHQQGKRQKTRAGESSKIRWPRNSQHTQDGRSDEGHHEREEEGPSERVWGAERSWLFSLSYTMKSRFTQTKCQQTCSWRRI